MPWPDPVGPLLARSDSRASQALRWGLRGLRATLQAALEEVPGDPGCTDLRGLLAELDRLLEPAGPLSGPSLPLAEPGDSSSSGGPEALPPSTQQTATPRLLPLVRAITADPRFREMLHGKALRESSDEEIWNDVQRLFLRAPADLAAEGRLRAMLLVTQLGAEMDLGRTETLPLGHDEVIYPGLAGSVQVTGLRSALSAPLDPRVSAPPDGDLRFLAGVTSAYLWFIEHDPNLRHCLRSVFRFGVPPLTGDQRNRYLSELLRLWERVRTGSLDGHGMKDQMKARLDLDEALHSLVYQPPADPTSWWGRLQAQVRDTLFQARDRAVRAGCQVHLQLLGGSFADINRLAPDSLQVDYGIPGEVAVCPRVWARIEGEELKGRVLYRPPGEEP
ncbi:MAG TPA: hypothetical protein VE999_11345 [Gemmataceae bacterium]|nr:hypothetical protein [Gemmataceae bacterium]